MKGRKAETGGGPHSSSQGEKRSLGDLQKVPALGGFVSSVFPQQRLTHAPLKAMSRV